MKKVVIIISILFIAASGTPTKPIDIQPVRVLKEAVDKLDESMQERYFTGGDANMLWKICNEFYLEMYNNILGPKMPDEKFKNTPSNYPDGLRIFTPQHGGMGLTYKAHRPPGNAAQDLKISSVPLNNEKSIFLLIYTRYWWNGPNCEGPVIFPGTFRIMDRETTTGKYKITARFEDTNFYHHIAMLRKFKFHDGRTITEYEWAPRQLDPKIESLGNLINFETTYIIGGQPGNPYISVMTVFWEYTPQKRKLKATHFTYQPYKPSDPNLKIYEKMKDGGSVLIPE